MHSLRHLLAFLCAVGLVLLSHPPVQADITVGEAAAGISGSSLVELNPDSSGYLYASDYTAPAILKVDAAGGQYSRYVFSTGAGFLIQPGDAKPGPAGEVWWSDFGTAFGKLTFGPLQAEYWDLASKGLNPGGFAFDGSGRIWFSQPNKTQLIRFTPSDRSLCPFTVGGGGNYLISRGNQLWLTDQQTGRLLRFDASNNQLSAWTLPAGWQTPEGLALDSDGRVWWADSGAGIIGRLTPAANQAVIVTLPAGSQPVMLAAGTEVMWYTDGGGYAGFVDPALAGGSSQTLGVSTSNVAPGTCPTLGAGTVQAGVTVQTGTLSFGAVTWTAGTGQAGVIRYALPKVGATPSLPWGMAAIQGRMWAVDQNRNVLADAEAAAKSHRDYRAGGGWKPPELGRGDEGRGRRDGGGGELPGVAGHPAVLPALGCRCGAGDHDRRDQRAGWSPGRARCARLLRRPQRRPVRAPVQNVGPRRRVCVYISTVRMGR